MRRITRKMASSSEGEDSGSPSYCSKKASHDQQPRPVARNILRVSSSGVLASVISQGCNMPALSKKVSIGVLY